MVSVVFPLGKTEKRIYNCHKTSNFVDDCYQQVINIFCKTLIYDFMSLLIIKKLAENPLTVIPIPIKSDELEIVNTNTKTNIDAI